MAGKASATSTTLYRLTAVPKLKDAIRDKYLDDDAKFTEVDCTVGDRAALLVHGHMKTDRARWADRLGSLINVPFDAANQNAAAVLVVACQGDGTT